MNTDIVGYAQQLRHEAKAMLEAATTGDKELAASSVALGNAPILFPKSAPVIFTPNAGGAFGVEAKPSKNAALEKIALRLGEVYAQLESVKAAYVQTEGEFGFHTLNIGAESALCLGVMNALSGYLSAEGLVASAAAAAMGAGTVPNGYQKSAGGILLPAKAS